MQAPEETKDTVVSSSVPTGERDVPGRNRVANASDCPSLCVLVSVCGGGAFLLKLN